MSKPKALPDHLRPVVQLFGLDELGLDYACITIPNEYVFKTWFYPINDVYDNYLNLYVLLAPHDNSIITVRVSRISMYIKLEDEHGYAVGVADKEALVRQLTLWKYPKAMHLMRQYKIDNLLV